MVKKHNHLELNFCDPFGCAGGGAAYKAGFEAGRECFDFYDRIYGIRDYLDLFKSKCLVFYNIIYQATVL